MVHVAAVDLGASSGRVVLGEVGPDRLRLDVVARLANEPVGTGDGLHWNVSGLYDAVLDGLRAAVASSLGRLASVAVDSWAVDYGLLSEGRLLAEPFHYRDAGRTAGVDVVHAVLPHEELYPRNGLQFLPFNTLYQLAADPLVDRADRLLLVPDLIAFWLTGVPVTERTNASTTGLLDVLTGEWDRALIRRLGLPEQLFGDLVDPGTVVGPVTGPALPDVLSGLTVTTVGSHDTASAVVGVPMHGETAAYISCGTWGLVGVELPAPVLSDAAREANFTNEGGVDGRVRFLTNVMGLWLLSEAIRGWERTGRSAPLVTLLAEAAAVTAPVPVFDVQDPRFLPPGDMAGRIASWCVEHDVAPPADRASTVRSILESLAEAFAVSVRRASHLSGRRVDVVHVVGGGALNELLCQLTADRCGLPVLAGPVEATALGNILVQGRTVGAVSGDLEALRRLVASTHEPRRFIPRSKSARVAG
ncbi:MULTISPECIES: rhamnulokinase [unclassified Nocardioides]|uniref:rhamnulokinase n=1 Tax=unclassified Nocardioides TaxID=2615069 RepID=UPI0007004C0B|nr:MULTISPECIES: rhamnulokinase family protein [unclassified Nocardioides]KQY56316.1 carbohydrate kinase [Nocardioides sp. Root140]KQZ75100.1 carbohydrate kinase [Nocardioides sp. Root151]KRF14178.1 carbohydrate kinase [Nocardioides sp. Soil796]